MSFVKLLAIIILPLLICCHRWWKYWLERTCGGLQHDLLPKVGLLPAWDHLSCGFVWPSLERIQGWSSVPCQISFCLLCLRVVLSEPPLSVGYAFSFELPHSPGLKTFKWTVRKCPSRHNNITCNVSESFFLFHARMGNMSRPKALFLQEKARTLLGGFLMFAQGITVKQCL